MSIQEYREAYMNGYTEGFRQAQENVNVQPVYFDHTAIMERYNVGENVARDIIRDIRRECGGGRLGHVSRVLRSEVEYWESIVDKRRVRI